MAYWEEYTWIVVAAALAAIFMAYGIGANDVANAFATSVGSKALTLWQAVIIAAIFEFAGAVLLGRGVTTTIKNGIISGKAFNDEPEILMYGMLCALLAAGTWLLVATYFEMAVSTTHSIIGGILGFAIVSKGSSSIDWYSKTDTGIQIAGVAAIVLSWAISPILSGLVAAFGFFMVRTFVMRHANAYTRVFYFFPVLVFVCVWVNVFYVLDKGITKQVEMEFVKTLWLSAVIALGIAIVCALCMPLLRKQLDKQAETAAAITATGIMLSEEEAKAQGIKTMDADPKEMDSKSSTWFSALKGGVTHDVHSVTTSDERTAELHARAELFDPKAESGFRFLQIFTASCDSFAHGANDVANAIGPFAAIWEIYRHGKILKKSSVPIWILALGGFGIVLGLATYGYNIIRAIGVKMIKVTPSRGFAIELGSAIVIITGSRYELPLSTTHCQVGATVAVGLLEHGTRGVHWPLVAKTLTGWVGTLLVVGSLSAALMAFGIYSPNFHASELDTRFHKQINTTALAQIAQLRVCTTPGLAANLDATSKWVIAASKDIKQTDNILDAEKYTNALHAANFQACAPTFTPIPADAKAFYKL